MNLNQPSGKGRTAIVIGAGVAGLATSIRLACQGYEVKVFEKNAFPGGKLHHFEQDGFQFDAGPSLFTRPQLIEELFTLAGEPIEAYFSYQRLPVSCHYFYEDGTQLNAYADRNLLARELSEKHGEREAHVVGYLDKAAGLFEKVGNIFLEHSLHDGAVLREASVSSAIRATRWQHLFSSMHRLNAAAFVNPKTTQLFDRYATYNGSNPYRAPGMLSMIAHLEHNEGSFYPRGGMISITRALHRLAEKKGVQFYFNAPVTRIEITNGRATGICCGDEKYAADVVVSNVDVYFTYLRLLQQPAMAKRILRQERSSSAMIFYWGIRQSFPQLSLHNIFFSADYEQEFDHLFRLKTLHDDPTVYINITSKCEPGVQAPQGMENWFVMINVPANIGQDWERYRSESRARILKKLSRLLGQDIASLIVNESVADPVSIEALTDSYQGSLYGTSSNSRLAAFLRHANFSKSIPGLYFVGGSVHPGGGIPLCLSSAAIAASVIQRKEK
ncbi:MAG: 1-hydroxycarotenoid 3,4-desaturase CrtD [Bacteroidota bacterium]|jgi:phytoene desaturase